MYTMGNLRMIKAPSGIEGPYVHGSQWHRGALHMITEYIGVGRMGSMSTAASGSGPAGMFSSIFTENVKVE